MQSTTAEHKMPLVAAHQITKYFDDVCALDHLTLTVKAGEVLGLLGPNGAGKTSAIHIILGLLLPTSGELRVLGLDPIKDRYQILPRINFTSAYVQLPSNLKVIENMKIYAGLYGLKKPREKIDELLELFEMTPLLQRVTGTLSSGEKTRLNLCKAFLNDPELLLLDEPTASLDPDMAEKVRGVLKRMQSHSHLGMIYTSHNMQEVEEMCDNIIFIHEGKILAEGQSAELKARYGHARLDEVFIHLVRRSS